MNLTYAGLELRRMARDREALILTAGLPVGLFLAYYSIWGGESTTSVLMVMMAVLGVLASTSAAGGRVSRERHLGWNRQLRLSAMRPASYVTAKTLVGVVTASVSVGCVFLASLVIQRGDAPLAMMAEALGILVVGTIPFVLMGIFVGLVGAQNTAQPLGTLIMMVNALLGGVFVAITDMPAAMAAIAEWTPGYWMNALAQSAFGLPVDSGRAWATLGVWTVVFAVAIGWRYRAHEK